MYFDKYLLRSIMDPVVKSIKICTYVVCGVYLFVIYHNAVFSKHMYREALQSLVH